MVNKPHTLATIHADGSVTLEGVGFEGGECLKAAEPFRKALGGTGDSKKKPEYYNQGGEQQGVQAEQ